MDLDKYTLCICFIIEFGCYCRLCWCHNDGKWLENVFIYFVILYIMYYINIYIETALATDTAVIHAW